VDLVGGSGGGDERIGGKSPPRHEGGGGGAGQGAVRLVEARARYLGSMRGDLGREEVAMSARGVRTLTPVHGGDIVAWTTPVTPREVVMTVSRSGQRARGMESGEERVTVERMTGRKMMPSSPGPGGVDHVAAALQWGSGGEGGTKAMPPPQAPPPPSRICEADLAATERMLAATRRSPHHPAVTASPATLNLPSSMRYNPDLLRRLFPPRK
jgi:hypothetical protein